MALTLKKIYEHTQKCYGIKLLAGKRGLSQVIKWIHTLESEQAAGFLHGGELVFTTGIGIEDPGWLLRFAEILKKQKACGLVVNLGPYVKVLPKELEQYCNQAAFPLFTIPWETRLVDMTRDFCNQIIEEEKTEESVGELLKSLILWPEKYKEIIPVLEKKGICSRGNCQVLCLSIKAEMEILPEGYLEFVYGRIAALLCEKSFSTAEFEMEGVLVIVLFGCQKAEGAKVIGELLALQKERMGKVGIRIGAGAAEEGIERLGENYIRAKRLLDACERKGSTSLLYDELTVEKLLFNVREEYVLQEYYDNYVGRLLAYDKEHGTEYTKTLSAYLQFDGSILQTAEQLFIHRNTVNYQLNRIKEILNCDFSTLDGKLKLKLAFLIREFHAFRRA